VWTSVRWSLYRVDAPRPLASGARVVGIDADRVLLRTAAPGAIVLRVRWSRYWTGGDAVCITRRPDGYMDLVVRRAGLITLRSSALTLVSRSHAC
jgi:hypothetical protein